MRERDCQGKGETREGERQGKGLREMHGEGESRLGGQWVYVSSQTILDL